MMDETLLDRLKRELPESWWVHVPEETPERQTDGARWFVIHTQAGWEAAVDRLLKLRGFGRWYPFLLVKRWRNLGSGKGRKLEEVERPFLPRYTFVRCRANEVGEVNRIAGVSTVVHVGEEPLYVPDKVMLALMREAAEDGQVGADDRTRRAFAFKGKNGSVVRMGGGSPFAGFNAVVASLRSLDTKGEISLWLDLFGRKTEIVVPADSVELV